MRIDIIQAYADALYVATTQRPVPSTRDPRCTQTRDVTSEHPTPAPSPAGWCRFSRWLRQGSAGLVAASTAKKCS